MSISQKLHDLLDKFFTSGSGNLLNGSGHIVASVVNDLIPNAGGGMQQLTVDDTVGGVQFSALDGATQYVFWTSETSDCRVTFDGSAPTTTNGHLIVEGSSGLWPADLAADAKFIRTTGESAVITATEMEMP